MMHQIIAPSVDHALSAGLDLLENDGDHEMSRAGPVLVAPNPVVTTWLPHVSRVSLSRVRDANPFFHLYEAMWMLSGGRCPQPLDEFVHDFSSRFAEPSGEQHGAYGHRWREAFGVDQLDHCVELLRRDQTSRQAVIQMWDAGAHDDLTGDWRDRPCNTHAYLRVRDGVLDLTVCCRSNDVIWGCMSANVVHFSFLHEYLAALIGVGRGSYYQVSNNFHAYVTVVERLRSRGPLDLPNHPLPGSLPMVDDPQTFDGDLSVVMARINGPGEPPTGLRNTFLTETFYHAILAFRAYRTRATRSDVLDLASMVQAPDWRAACMGWLERRMDKWR